MNELIKSKSAKRRNAYKLITVVSTASSSTLPTPQPKPYVLTPSKTYHNSPKPTILFRGSSRVTTEVHNDQVDSHNTITEYSFGYTNLSFFNTSTNRWQLLSNDQDKFIVTADTIQLARSEFWARWSLYLKARFKISFAQIIEL